ncbi:TIGR02234 family membrane protein [Actinacidiphila rubida]|uniref:Trp region conserved hypothetical membrane protein n=1 Tax=Actinacidiphila rubida TaxID=310780 RepID=A0A1H8IJ39_9ACTN|nr:TIGR02234 family membrane protein [Actinacidiphila rubida]SEN68226.1 trp region conserved hypothetical membrane protein [Actinacidiphila rubida]
MTAVPPPRAEQEPAPTEAAADPSATAGAPGAGAAPDAARRSAMRALAVALPLGAIGSALVLLGSGKTWSKGLAQFSGTGLSVHASGTSTTALPGALALVGLASLVAVFAVRRAGRYVVTALLALSGLGVVVTTLASRADHHALDSEAARATGLRHAVATHATITAWPLVVAAGGVLLLLAGLLALRHGQRWPAMSSRYDRKGGPAAATRAPAPVDPDRAEDLWKALDRGEDPTQSPG